MSLKFQHMKEVAASGKVSKASVKRGLDAYFPTQVTSSSSILSTSEKNNKSVASKGSIQSIVTPDKTNSCKKLKSSGDVCKFCKKSGEMCHNKKFGPYLYKAAIKLYKEEVKKDAKVSVGMVEVLFAQCYHVLAKHEAFECHGGDALELEYTCGN